MADERTIQPSNDAEATAIAVAARIAEGITANAPDGMRKKAALVGELVDLILRRKSLPQSGRGLAG